MNKQTTILRNDKMQTGWMYDRGALSPAPRVLGHECPGFRRSIRA